MRLLLAVLIPIGLLVLALLAFPVVLLGRPEQRLEIARGMSRTLGALWDGQGDCTFSAWSWRMLLLGKRWGPARVRLVDALNRSPGHCQRAWEWHEAHGLFSSDAAG